MKIRTQLYITFIIVTLVLAGSFIGVAYFSMVAHFEQHEGNRLQENVMQSAKAIDKFMFSRVKDFNVLSNNPLFSMSSNKIIYDYLSHVVDQYPYYENIFFVNKNAIIISSSDKRFIGKNILILEPDIKDEFYKTINGGHENVYISGIANVSQEEMEANSPLDIELLSDVIDLKGNVIGILIGMVNIQFIRDMVFDIDNRTIGNENAYLVNDPGDVLISANPEPGILQPHPDLSIQNLQQKLEGDENGFLIYVNSKGEKVISGYADLSEYGAEKVGDWSLLSTAPYDEVMKPVFQMLYRTVSVFSLIFVCIIVLVIILSGTLTKPIIELHRAVSNFHLGDEPVKLMIGKNYEVGSLCKSFNTMTEKLYISLNEIKILATTDPLTKLPNRRSMMVELENATIRFKRNSTPFTIAISDIDNFKLFNDKYGHDHGDFVLTSVAETMRSTIREQDFLARWGGEEFLFVFPDTNSDGGKIIAEKIRKGISSSNYRCKDLKLSVTMTFGLCVFCDPAMDLETCINSADAALYRGKASGKNCVILAEPLK
jgi:diguanylate cyclase (GGDEF)-like protein